MANLSSVLQGIPGLRGWQAQDQFRQNMQQGDQATQLNQMKLADVFQQHQKQQKLQEIMSQSGGNPAKAVPLLLQGGFQQEAAQLHALLPKPAEPFTLNAGDSRYDASGKVIVSGVPKVTTKFEKDYPIGKDQVQPHFSKDEGATWEPVPNSKPSSKFAKQVSGLSDGGILSPEAIDDAAARYRMTGVMPSMGMGGATARAKILNRAAEQAAETGQTGEEIAYRQMQGKADQQALGQLEKQATMVGAFEKTANSNLQLAVSLSDKVSRSGSPVFDKWVQMGRKSIAGDPDVAKFHAANETFINEYAKIMSGSMGNTAISDAARANAHEVLSHAFTKEQYREVTNTLKTEMENRIKGFNDQRNEVKTRLTGGATSAPEIPAIVTPAKETKVINGKTYTKIDGQWHE